MSASKSAPASYLLVFHGSRDPRPAQATERLAQFVRSQLELNHADPAPFQSAGAGEYHKPSRRLEPIPGAVAGCHLAELTEFGPYPVQLPLVGTACLEAGVLSLHEQMIDFGHRVRAAGVRSLRIVPLFLLRGVHVLEDIPTEVHQAQRSLPELSLTLCPHLGSHPGLKTLVQTKLQSVAADAWLLLAHGSRRAESNRPIQALAQSLGGTTAYWSVAPSLETQVIQLIQKGVQRLTILPYFLFTGTTTDAVTQRTEDLAERFSTIKFHLLPPLGPSPELAQLVVDLALNRMPPQPSQGTIPLKRVALRHYTPAASMVS